MGYGSGLPRWLPNLTYQSRPPIDEVMREFGSPPAVVLDLGAGGRRIASHVTTVDFAPLAHSDCIADICSTPFSSGSIDLVIATGVLEHVQDDRMFLAEVHRILKPGGIVHIEVPFLQQYHEDPIDCRRYTQPGLVRLLEQHGFRQHRSGAHIGPTVTMVTLASYYAALLFEGRSSAARLMSNAAFAAVSVMGWPFKFLDYWLVSRRSAHRLAFGVYCTAIRM